MSEWISYKLDDFAFINPRTSLSKGSKAKKVAMESIQPFCKKISNFTIEAYNGGVKFQNGDTLIARITPSLENGKTSLVDFLDDDEIGFGSTEFISLREKESISDKDFLYYLSISPDFRDVAIQSMTGSSGRQRVDTETVKEYEFFTPSLPEQKAIASVLSSLDDKIDLLHRQNETLEKMAETLFRKWFVEDAKEEWEEKSLSSIAEFLNGLACQKYPPKNNLDRLPVLKIKELSNGFTDNSDWCSSDVNNKYLIQNGDVIFSWSASLLVKIWDGEQCILNQHLFKVTSVDFPKWYYYLWCKQHLVEFISISTSHATTMGHIKRSDLDNAKVLVPSNDELLIMNTSFEPLINKIISNNKQLKKLTQLRDTLLPKLMSGEVRVKLD
jgi:type I restriction enzyme S subunit